MRERHGGCYYFTRLQDVTLIHKCMVAWTVWNFTAMNGLTGVFNDLLNDTTFIIMESSYIKLVKRFVVLQHTRSCRTPTVIEARSIL